MLIEKKREPPLGRTALARTYCPEVFLGVMVIGVQPNHPHSASSFTLIRWLPIGVLQRSRCPSVSEMAVVQTANRDSSVQLESVRE